MGAYFLESGAAAKLYFLERGTRWVRDLTDPEYQHDLFVTRITQVEVAAALFRRERSGDLSAEDAARALASWREDLQRTFRVVELSPALADEAVRVSGWHALPAAGCLQLAAALTLERHRRDTGLASLTLVSADPELNEAAGAEGMLVEDPGGYP